MIRGSSIREDRQTAAYVYSIIVEESWKQGSGGGIATRRRTNGRVYFSIHGALKVPSVTHSKLLENKEALS